MFEVTLRETMQSVMLFYVLVELLLRFLKKKNFIIYILYIQ